MSETGWLDEDEVNLSANAFAERDSCFQDVPDRKADSPTIHELETTEGVTEFDDLHLNQGLDAIVRVDSQRKRRRVGAIPLYCILMGVIAVVAITTMGIMLPKSNNNDTSEPRTVQSNEEQVTEIQKALVEQGILNENDSVEPGSPRYKAIQFVAVHSESVSQSDSPSQEINSYAFIARYVIALTLYTLRGPWFTINSPICSLFHKQGEPLSGIRCDEKGHPTSLNLGTYSFPLEQLKFTKSSFFELVGLAEGQALSGQIPTEFGLLTSVQHLNFVNNSLDGSIPSELCKLDQLLSLKLGWNKLRGTVPECMGQMESLQLLNLNFNDLGGSLPEKSFRNLHEMYINANNFTQSLPDLVGNMSKLVGFSARDNNFYGNVASAFDRHAESLVFLDLGSNRRLGGQFPQSLLTNAPNLEYLSIGNNAIEGRLPWNIPQNDKLKVLSVYSNRMKGMIPPSIANLTSLTQFIASDNQFSGPLPSKLPTGLAALFLSGNPFSPGPIPEEWASLQRMIAFRMRRTRRNGNLPAWVGQNWTELTLLDIGANNFEGSIPASWGKLPQLEYLFLNGNAQVSGGVPESFATSSWKKVVVYQTNVTGNWEFACPKTDPEPAVLGTHIDKCSCCVLCDEWTCAKEFIDRTDKTVNWVYRNYLGV
ncbi:hypothetical protein FisN_20Hh063 [Fistulifera solaris]|jgi:Leucine-rich repeat (LRR) protein|uniref:L domain-like protein n=1 Tax=Fistulifera solaris TaxID=1519565 RepID=A0A1Z5KC91_FISSO|nr:hypothetical protein FisN_20Hh063 [Fistulifera solaris]|eukprot:GAX23857.1 hypothetical protein FisN_20Hh063 [Fistulifera solaris]